MNRYGRTGLRVLGGLLALMLAATLLPAAVTVHIQYTPQAARIRWTRTASI